LWEDLEFEIFIHHFGLENFFDSSDELVVEMGLENLKKTDVFGNNPTILKSSNIRNVLKRLNDAMRSGELNEYINSSFLVCDLRNENINEIIHVMFLMKTNKNYECFSMILASGYLLCFITRYLDHIYINQASSLYYTNTNSVLKGIYFEN
jgi:adenosine deaminase